MINKKFYPFKSNYLELKSGLNYHYIDEGKGQPLLMLHGNPTWSIYYRNLISYFSKNYRCIVPDHIGCGFSDKPSKEDYSYTLEQRVKDLEELINYLDLKKIILIVHDWGGMIGFTYTHFNRSKISKIVILNTAAFHLPLSKKFPLVLSISKSILGKFLILNFNAFAYIATYVCVKNKKFDKELREAYLYPYNNQRNRIATYEFVNDIPLSPNDKSYDLVSEVQSNLYKLSNIPMLVCWGKKDFVFDINFYNQWKKYFPNAEYHLFENYGHYILEDAHGEIELIIEKFLKK
ncbi:MAG: alpha/beta hydrolase [Candidatus Sericytochromatia bacterium]|nr:MAG: alpha/beta hydrolase [Candidatus Sericytochromatia bacterium]